MSDSLKCQYCDVPIRHQSSLYKHYQTKKCLKARSEMNDSQDKHNFSDMQTLKDELMNVKIELEKYKMKCEMLEMSNNELKFQYNELKEDYKDENHDTKKILTHLASKPTVTTNNTQNNIFNNLTPLDLSEERIKKALPMYTMPHYLRGAEGMADFLIENLLTDEKGNSMYACNDKNRCYFQYKALNGAKVDDIRCQHLIDTVKPYLAPRISAFKKERDDWIMETYGDSDEAYEFSGGQNLIGRKQMENHRLNNKAFDIAKIMVLRHK